MFDLRASCPSCGVAIDNVELHKRFHDTILIIAQRAFAMDDAEWAEVQKQAETELRAQGRTDI